MCGRYTNTGEIRDIRIQFNLDEIFSLFPRYNIAPGQNAPVIVNADGVRKLAMMRWGLVPSWAKDPSIGNRMINARAETLTEKPSFSGSSAKEDAWCSRGWRVSATGSSTVRYHAGRTSGRVTGLRICITLKS